MGFSSPLHNVKGYSASRPPVVIFVICLVLFACATLAMAFFIQNADIISNPEVKGNWKKFLARLSSLNLCATLNETYQDKDLSQISQLLDDNPYNVTEDNNHASITLFASVQLVRELKKLPSNSLALTGNFEIQGWVKSCYGENASSSSVNISFVVPQDLTQANVRDVCILLTGPLELLPFGRRSQLCTPSTINKTSAHIGTIRSVNSNNTNSFCKDGSLLKLNYSNEWDEKFYLSKQERGLIYLRLIHASYFLFVIAVTFVCYSFIRGRQNGSLPAVDKVNI